MSCRVLLIKHPQPVTFDFVNVFNTLQCFGCLLHSKFAVLNSFANSNCCINSQFGPYQNVSKTVLAWLVQKLWKIGHRSRERKSCMDNFLGEALQLLCWIMHTYFTLYLCCTQWRENMVTTLNEDWEKINMKRRRQESNRRTKAGDKWMRLKARKTEKSWKGTRERVLTSGDWTIAGTWLMLNAAHKT